MKDYYALLGVSSQATAEDIKRAYRKLAVQYHPDKNADPDAEFQFKELVEAYDVLSDPDKRNSYDLKRVFNYPGYGPFDEPAKKHRDTRYRPKPPGYRSQQQMTTLQVMQQALPYVFWVNIAGLVITVLFGLDYVLPYRTNIEEIKTIDRFSGRNYMFHQVITNTGRKIKLYDGKGMYFLKQKKIVLETTKIFRTVMSASGLKDAVYYSLAHPYRAIGIFPLALFISSGVALLTRKQISLPFNLSIVSAMFLIITLFIIL